MLWLPSSSTSNWLNNAERGFRRGGSGLFSFNGNNNTNWDNNSHVYACRGVAVVGAGLLYRITSGENFTEFSESIYICKRDVIPSLIGKN